MSTREERIRKAKKGVEAGKRSARKAKLLEPLATISKALGKNRDEPVKTRVIRRDMPVYDTTVPERKRVKRRLKFTGKIDPGTY